MFSIKHVELFRTVLKLFVILTYICDCLSICFITFYRYHLLTPQHLQQQQHLHQQHQQKCLNRYPIKNVSLNLPWRTNINQHKRQVRLYKHPKRMSIWTETCDIFDSDMFWSCLIRNMQTKANISHLKKRVSIIC